MPITKFTRCTGLVSKTFVATAARCSMDDRGQYIADDAHKVQFASGEVAPAKVHQRHHPFDEDEGFNDIMVLLLVMSHPYTGQSPFTVQSTPSALGTTVMLIGLGKNEEGSIPDTPLISGTLKTQR